MSVHKCTLRTFDLRSVRLKVTQGMNLFCLRILTPNVRRVRLRLLKKINICSYKHCMLPFRTQINTFLAFLMLSSQIRLHVRSVCSICLSTLAPNAANAEKCRNDGVKYHVHSKRDHLKSSYCLVPANTNRSMVACGNSVPTVAANECII